MRFHTCLLTAVCAAGFLGTAIAAPHHNPQDRAQDAGATAASDLITTGIILNVTDPQGLQALVADVTTPGSRDYHRFLSVEQFRDRFAPSDQAIHQLVSYLQSFGIQVDKVYPDHLDITVTGTADELNAALATQLRNYTRDGRQFHRPAWKFSLPGTLSKMVLAVPGLSNEPNQYRPMMVRTRGAAADASSAGVTWPSDKDASGKPQYFTVRDVANFYDVNPLYREGIDGSGQTIGIMTLANFEESDAYAYWRQLGIRVSPHRITKVMVDGGTPVAAGVGDSETSLDVEQSGGLAPRADVRVYIADPTSNNGFLDLFYTAVSENTADTVSISWGLPEEFYFAALNGGVDYTWELVAIDQALLEGAAQGQSFFAAAGDSGAYDANDPNFPFVPPQFSEQLTVDSPASDPYITAAGGTTAAGYIPASTSHPSCTAIPVPQERVWGWDFLYDNWAVCHGYTPYQLFPSGGGGGVSSYWGVPFYQQSVNGVQQTQPGQTLTYYPNYPSTDGAENLISLPADFAGRNVPDLSLNADPATGYIIRDCTDFRTTSSSSCSEGSWGGTSFVAPQLNGMTALIDQAAGGRVGLLNPMIYFLERGFAYGPWAPFNDITVGDNWYYAGVRGYDDGSGIGTVNVANLAFVYMMLAETGHDHHSR
jgi:kumamolisin